MEGAAAPTRLWGSSLQAAVLTTQRRPRGEFVSFTGLFLAAAFSYPSPADDSCCCRCSPHFSLCCFVLQMDVAARSLIIFNHLFTHSLCCRRSLLLSLFTAASINIFHVCPPVVCGGLASIKRASLRLQKDCLKCQRDHDGHPSLLPYLSWRGKAIIKITGLISIAAKETFFI